MTDKYNKYEGERKIAAIYEDHLSIMQEIQDLKFDLRDVDHEMMVTLVEQKRFDCFSINWRRIHKIASDNR